jgi:hypothetical protein
MGIFLLFQVFKVQVHPRYVDIQNLNQYSSDLKNASPITAEALSPQVKEVNERWNTLLKNIAEREVRKEKWQPNSAASYSTLVITIPM